MFDWFQTICIFIAFILLTMSNMLSTGVQNMQDNWPLYRCNPVMMPFAGFIAPDGTSTQDNFSFCVQNIMSSFGPTVTQPFSYLQNMTMEMMGSINTSTENSTDQSSDMKNRMGSIFGDIVNIFTNIIVEFNIIVIKLVDIQGKISGIIATLMYVMTTVVYAIESMWNGIPGKLIKALT